MAPKTNAAFVNDFYAIRNVRKDKEQRNALARRSVKRGMSLAFAAQAAGLTVTGLARIIK